VRRFCDAVDEGRQELTLWGTGRPRREFLNVDDVANAALFLMEKYEDQAFVNLGAGEDLPISELAEKIARATGFKGEIRWDSSKPDGMARKLMDVSKLKSLGFQAKISLDEGIASLIAEYRRRKAEGSL
jgi:GDP-L-fucose synthase